MMMMCIMLNNMIAEDEYDYDVLEVFKLDPMNTTMTRLYDSPRVCLGGPPMQHIHY